METAEEFLLNYLNNCIQVVNKDGNIGWYYSENSARNNKIAEMLEEEKDLSIEDCRILFYQDEKYKGFWVDYEEIWSIFESKYSMNYLQIHAFVKDVLERDFKLRGYTPRTSYY